MCIPKLSISGTYGLKVFVNLCISDVVLNLTDVSGITGKPDVKV